MIPNSIWYQCNKKPLATRKENDLESKFNAGAAEKLGVCFGPTQVLLSILSTHPGWHNWQDKRVNCPALGGLHKR